MNGRLSRVFIFAQLFVEKAYAVAGFFKDELEGGQGVAGVYKKQLEVSGVVQAVLLQAPGLTHQPFDAVSFAGFFKMPFAYAYAGLYGAFAGMIKHSYRA